MILKILLPLLAALGITMAVFTVLADNKAKPPAEPAVQPAAAPFKNYVAGAGLVEASTENISIGTHTSGVVTSVPVKAGARVKAGDPLFVIDDRTVRAELASRRAALAVARAKLERLRQQPRPEDLPPLEARVREVKSNVADLTSQLSMWEKTDKRAVSEEQLSQRRFAVGAAEARLAQAEADLALVKAGAWKPDIDAAAAEVESAQAQVDAAATEVDRHTVRAPVAGEVLKVNIRVGEFAMAGVGGSDATTALMVLGDTDVLHVRVDVDENDAWRVKAGATGDAFVRGNPSLKTGLKFVRFEPYVIPKKSLTGASTERVDTRVLQVIFSFDPKSLPVFVGQQMDVFIEAPPITG